MAGLIRSHKDDNGFSSTCSHITIDLNDKQFKWVDRNEFIFRGALYDVISFRIHAGKISFVCINDRQEEKLLAGFHKISELVSGITTHSKDKLRTAIVHHFIKAALVRERTLMTCYSSSVKLLSSEILPQYLQFRSPLIPPPKNA